MSTPDHQSDPLDCLSRADLISLVKRVRRDNASLRRQLTKIRKEHFPVKK